MVQVPVCYRFCPRERELIELFLIPKANGLELPDGHQILERSLYGAEPWNVIKDSDPWEWVDNTMKKKIIYVFTRVINKKGRLMIRTAGSGKWKESSAGMKITCSDGNVLGYRRNFTYKPKKGENETRGKWTMHEYSLTDKKDCNDGDVMVCSIFHHVEKEGSGDKDEGPGSDSDAPLHSADKTSKRARRGGASRDQTGNQEGGQVVGVDAPGPSVNVSTDLRLGNQEICRVFSKKTENQEVVPYPAAPPQDAHISTDLRLGFAQQIENQEVVSYPAAHPQDADSSDTN